MNNDQSPLDLVIRVTFAMMTSEQGQGQGQTEDWIM